MQIVRTSFFPWAVDSSMVVRNDRRTRSRRRTPMGVVVERKMALLRSTKCCHCASYHSWQSHSKKVILNYFLEKTGMTPGLGMHWNGVGNHHTLERTLDYAPEAYAWRLLETTWVSRHSHWIIFVGVGSYRSWLGVVAASDGAGPSNGSRATVDPAEATYDDRWSGGRY